MSKSKLIIRLIDIVFILLFGFIAVSQIESSAAIEPPKSSEAENSAPENTTTLIVGVTNQGTYPVGSGEVVFNNIRELERHLLASLNQAEFEGKQLGIRIRANWDSPVEHSMAVAQLCRDLGIPKGLDVVKKQY